MYEDGTWIARDPPGSTRVSRPSSEGPKELDVQESYYKALLNRFRILREQLTKDVSNKALRSVKSAPHPQGRQGWLHSLDREFPTPAQLAKMDTYTIFNGLKYCAHSFDRFDYISMQKSAWIWALLAKAPESGNLDYTRVGNIRDLGHKAGQCSLRLRSGKSMRTSNHPKDEKKKEDNEESSAAPEQSTSLKNDKAAAERDTSMSGVGEPEVAEDDKTSGSPKPPTIQNGEDEKSDTDMSISDEGEQSEAKKLTPLEEARARLLAQLGDRLVQPGLSHTTSGPAQNGSDNTSSLTTPSRGYFLSRAEAEAQRQKIREQDLKTNKAKPSTVPPATLATSELKDSSTGGAPSEEDKKDHNTHATIDMILTIVAELYGQRDLLRFREEWP